MDMFQSTYCAAIQRFAADDRRSIEIVNLDPAAEHFDYQPMVDIRELIHLDDAMEDEELHYGPNGGLVFCIEYGICPTITVLFYNVRLRSLADTSSATKSG